MADSDSDSNAPNVYVASMFKEAPDSRRPVTRNLDNPINTATAWPSKYVAIDSKKAPEEGKFPMSTKYSYMDSASLVASALKPGSVAARKAKQQAQKGKGTGIETPQAYQLGVNMAPGRATPMTEYEIDDSPSAARGGKGASATSSRKGKRRADADLGDEDRDEAEEATPVQRKKSRRTTYLEVANQQPAKASSKLLSRVDTMFTTGSNNPYYKVPDTSEQALAGDRMLMKWKAEGKPWEKIVAEWTRLTGRPTDEGNMTVRYLRLQEKYANSSKEFDEAIIEAKKVAAKQSGGDLWDRVSETLKAEYNMILDPSVCRKRFFKMEAEREEAAKEAEAREESEKDYKEAKKALPTELDELYQGVQEQGPSSYFSVTGEEYLGDRRTKAQMAAAEDDVSGDELS